MAILSFGHNNALSWFLSILMSKMLAGLKIWPKTQQLIDFSLDFLDVKLVGLVSLVTVQGTKSSDLFIFRQTINRHYKWDRERLETLGISTVVSVKLETTFP